MGQKVNPIGIRLGISRPWSSVWYADTKAFPALVESDYRIREMLRKRLKDAAVSHIDIERHRESTQIQIHTARPGTVIGKKGEDIERLRRDLAKLIGSQLHQVRVNINEIKKPELHARLVAENIASQLERRVMFRRAMRRAVSTTMRLGAQGIKVKVSGRLNGAEIARSEWYREGRVPLHTFRADIDYGVAEAFTTYGVVGVKVWIFRGEKSSPQDKPATADAAPGGPGAPGGAGAPAAPGGAGAPSAPAAPGGAGAPAAPGAPSAPAAPGGKAAASAESAEGAEAPAQVTPS